DVLVQVGKIEPRSLFKKRRQSGVKLFWNILTRRVEVAGGLFLHLYRADFNPRSRSIFKFRVSLPLRFRGGEIPSVATGCSAHLVLSGRLDILVHAKEVVRVVLALHLGEAIVIRAIGGAHTISFVGGEEIDVCAAAGERRRGIE